MKLGRHREGTTSTGKSFFVALMDPLQRSFSIEEVPCPVPYAEYDHVKPETSRQTRSLPRGEGERVSVALMFRWGGMGGVGLQDSYLR